MRIRLSFILLFFILWSNISYAQQAIIKGRIQDTLNNNYLPHAAVTLIHASDSIMETFARTKDDGSFELHAASGDRYLVMITYPGFVDYIDIVTVKDGKTKDMGNIPMITRSHLLTEFVFEQNRGAIKVKGDTIEYVADSFKTKDNATVEDLLKRLPGLQVDRNGQVTAQGEKVQKILVDGEEFFSDDPAVVTRNLQANAIDKVQVFDKKSDQAEFTGIDDGIKTKTIDLKLKEDRKKGFFGKAVAGGGTDGSPNGFFENQAMINGFKGKRQLSVFGIMSNTGKAGLGWNDAEKYGTSNNSFDVSSDGSVTSYYDNEDNDNVSWNGTYNGEGLPTVWTTGAHYANKWNEDKEHVSANYRFAKQNIETAGNTTTQYITPGSSYTTVEKRNAFSSGLRHNLGGLFEWKTDSLSNLKVSVSGNYANTKSHTDYTTDSRTPEDSLMNSGHRSINSDASSKSEKVDIFWRKRFKKKGRTISIDIPESYKETNSTSYLISSNTYHYTDTLGNPYSYTLPVNQEKLNTGATFSIGTKIEYTEPLSKVAYIDASYGLKMDDSKAARTTLDTNNIDGNYTDTNALYTSNYLYNVLTNSGGLSLRFVYKKFNFSFGGTVANAAFKQQDLNYDTTYNYNYLNFFPKADFSYKFENQASFNFHYYGATRQPSLSQLQPLRDNTDPLNIAIGNPDLKQEFRHTINARYNSYKVLSGRYIWAGATLGLVQNAITRTDTVFPGGLREYQYRNMNGNYFVSAFGGYGSRIPKTQVQAGFWLNVNLAHSNTLVNGQKNVSDNNSYTFGPRIEYNKPDKFEFTISPQVVYNDNKATISTNIASYWSGQIDFDGSVQLPLKFEVGTDINWYLRERTDVFTTNNNVFRWNAYVSKKFLKKSQLELRVSAFDILDQNKGFNRYAQSSYIYENNYNTIRRYGLLSLIWNFTKTSAGAAPPDDGPKMRWRG
ncbi:MAG: hypothetical protein BGO69_03755 [Bacteroidetes bacterium 46-16]|nr:MAG: hypothetical protein BGO69_03755 [Bacteroidetes bacterium 46-16]